MSLTLVPAITAHANILSTLQASAYGPQGEDAWTAKSFNASIQNPSMLCYIALKLEEPVGFILLQKVDEVVEIITLGVLPDYQRQGIAAQILRDVFTRHKPATAYLEVRADNVAAIRLYERQGFVVTGKREHYYKLINGKRVDAITMMREFG